jgi:hypothetical protein
MHGGTTIKNEVFSFVGFSVTRIHDKILVFRHRYVGKCGVPQVRLENRNRVTHLQLISRYRRQVRYGLRTARR